MQSRRPGTYGCPIQPITAPGYSKPNSLRTSRSRPRYSSGEAATSLGILKASSSFWLAAAP